MAKSAGFCFGVKRAVKLAQQTALQGKPVEMLGDIVHNEAVVKEIKKTGIVKVNHLSDGTGKTLLIRAHGTGKATITKARELGYRIIDATCPKVKEIHSIARDMEQKGYRLIIIGDKDHDEVRGIIGQIHSPAIVIENPDSISPDKIKNLQRAAVVVQSTQSLENVKAILEALRPQIKDLMFFNTICKATRDRQKEIKTLPLQNDVMIIIGSKTSANTKRLYEISKSLNQRSYWIESTADLQKEWFKDARHVGITAGASTPEESIQCIVSYLKQLSTD